MDMTTIQRSVSDAWQLIFPPVLTVFFLFITAYLIVVDPVLLPFKKVTAYGLNLLQDANSEKIIEFYGISKLMPIIVLFAIVSLLYLSMLAVQFVGNVLPVTPTYNPDMLFLSIDHSDRLARIWSRFPSVQTFSNLRTIIQERSYKAEKELDKRSLGIENWKSEAGAR